MAIDDAGGLTVTFLIGAAVRHVVHHGFQRPFNGLVNGYPFRSKHGIDALKLHVIIPHNWHLYSTPLYGFFRRLIGGQVMDNAAGNQLGPAIFIKPGGIAKKPADKSAVPVGTAQSLTLLQRIEDNTYW